VTRDVVKLEEQGWRALSSSPSQATTFYEDVLDEQVVMALPDNVLLHDRSEILRSLAGQPWATYELEQLVLLEPTDDIAVVVYGVVARRQGSRPYSALVTSTYVLREGDWKLTLHQQTPR
jgi:hypothetical protein